MLEALRKRRRAFSSLRGAAQAERSASGHESSATSRPAEHQRTCPEGRPAEGPSHGPKAVQRGAGRDRRDTSLRAARCGQPAASGQHASASHRHERGMRAHARCERCRGGSPGGGRLTVRPAPTQSGRARRRASPGWRRGQKRRRQTARQATPRGPNTSTRSARREQGDAPSSSRSGTTQMVRGQAHETAKKRKHAQPKNTGSLAASHGDPVRCTGRGCSSSSRRPTRHRP